MDMKMKKYLSLILTLCFQISIMYGQTDKSPTHYFAAGILDHKIGFSWVGYAHTIMQNNNNELFVGGGTLIAMSSVAAGWKYYFNDTPIKAYSVLAIHGFYFKDMLKGKPFMSLGIEKKLTGKLYVNLGINSTLEENTSSPKMYWVPSINANWRIE